MRRKKRTPEFRISQHIWEHIDKIGSNGLAVYAALKSYQNGRNKKCFPSYDTLSRRTGLNRSTVIKYVQILIDAGLISKEAASGEDGRQTSNRYSFRELAAEVVREIAQKAVDIVRGRAEQPPLVRVEMADPPISNNYLLTKKQDECPHKDIANPVEGVVYCRNCYANLDATGTSLEEIGTAVYNLE